jgi:flagellar biosynthesis protein FlhF
MKLKSFHAKSMSDAMRQVRDTLGEDAIIVTSREEPSGWVKVTAAVEQGNPAREEAPAPDAIAEMITEAMLKHRVPAETGEKVISAAMTRAETNPQEALAAALRQVLSFAKAEREPKPLILAGPPGAGKTLMTAKLAAREALAGGRPAIITTDTARAGGVEQLSAFLHILGLPLLQAENAKDLKSALADAPAGERVIIDTGGLNPFDPQEMKFLARLMAAAEMDAALVLPAGVDAEESAEMAMTFSVLGVKRLMPTRLDFARRLGGILSAADKGGLSFTEGSHTPQVADGILPLTPEALAGLLMPHLPRRK